MAEGDPKISATTMHVDELVDRAMRGRIRVPTFQRGLKWKASHVQELFDSVYLGYPIGTLLMWKRPAEAGTVRIGPIEIAASAMEDTWWVVDGQQRLTSLVAGLRHPNPDQFEDPFVVYFDLALPRNAPLFFRPHRLRPRSDLHVPLARVLDAAQFQEWLFELVERTGRRDLISVASDLAVRLRNYRVPIYVIETDDADTARKIFLRTNFSGRRMEPHEVFAALAPAATDRDMAPERIAERLSVDFGPVEPNLVAKVARSLFGDDVDQRRQAEESIRAALNFLVVSDVPHLRLLPARLTPVVVLARFFNRFPEPHERSRRLLRRWLWRGFFGDALPSDARSLRRAVSAVGRDESDSVQALLAQVPISNPPDLTPRFDARYGPARLAMLVLALARPKAPLDSEEDGLFAWLQKFEADVFTRFPGAPNRPEARFLTPGIAPAAWRTVLLSWAREDENHPALASHLISPESARALLLGDTAGFISMRRETLNARAREVWSAYGEPEHNDRPPLVLR